MVRAQRSYNTDFTYASMIFITRRGAARVNRSAVRKQGKKDKGCIVPERTRDVTISAVLDFYNDI